jgi:hypothetical protein
VRRRLLALGALLWLAAPGLAGAERIRDFQAEVWLLQSGELRVEERIVYDFEGARKHGIFRDLPVRYGRGAAADYRIALDVESVTDANGASHPFRVSSEGAMRRIRIGSPDRKVTGVHEYRIAYSVRRGILWFPEHDELYWNATGTEWRVPIDSTSVRIHLPDGVTEEVPFLCFTGPRGSIQSRCTGAQEHGVVSITADRPFVAGEGLTVVVSLPKGALSEPSALAKALDRASDWLSWPSPCPSWSSSAWAPCGGRSAGTPPAGSPFRCATSLRKT